jgi:hypothetical protein
MSSNKSHHVISFEKLGREEKSSEYVHPFGEYKNAKCPLCNAVLANCKAMYLHVAERHPRSAASTLLPGRSFSVPDYKLKSLPKGLEVVCIICRRSMCEEKYISHILWSHPWILDESTRAAWDAERSQIQHEPYEKIKVDVPDSLHCDQDMDCASIGDIIAAKHQHIERDEERKDSPKNDAVKITVSRNEPFCASNAFPPLPTMITSASLVSYLESLGFKAESTRDSRGCLYVYLGERRFKVLAEFLKDNGVWIKFNPERRGKRIRDRWEIDPGMRLRHL